MSIDIAGLPFIYRRSPVYISLSPWGHYLTSQRDETELQTWCLGDNLFFNVLGHILRKLTVVDEEDGDKERIPLTDPWTHPDRLARLYHHLIR
jgi:hypothetical protein